MGGKGVRKNIGWKMLLAALVFVLLQGMLKSCQMSRQETAEGQAALGTVLLETLAAGITDTLYGQFVPMYVLGANNPRGGHWLVQEQIDGLLPFYEYSRTGITETIFPVPDGQDDTVVVARESDNGMDANQNSAEGATPVVAQEGAVDAQQIGREDGQKSLSELLAAENEAAMQANLQTQEVVESQETVEQQEPLQAGLFVAHTQMEQVDIELLSDYETLLHQFYTVDANTSASSERLNVEKFLEKDMTIQKDSEGPQILIFHTHSQETFIDSVPGDESTSIMGVGDRLAQILQETYGYEVLHHKGKYDVETRDDAYSEALPEIERVLKENPSVQVVIDLHRDQMPEGTKLYMDLDGRPTARFMFFNGLSRTKKTGNISYLHNENLDYNLAFSFQMQKKAMEYYPGLTRKIYLKGYRYNMHLAQKYLLVELGAQNNTVEEAMNACDPLAHILDLVLTGQ